MARRRDLDRPEALWKEKDLSNGSEVDTMVLILRTRGCSWSRSGGCNMCGYNIASDGEVDTSQLLNQLDVAMERYEGEPFVKVYTSGSFLDERELPPSFRDELLQRFSSVERLLVESRPEFINSETLSAMPTHTTLAIGLESADDAVLRHSVRKGFRTTDYVRAADEIREAGMELRSYLLLKPPFLSEAAAIADARDSVEFAARHGGEVSLNPVNVQKGTLVERLWRKGDYRPPWIWSLVEVMRTADRGDARLMSSPSGGGSRRGVHNCGECDAKILEGVQRFSFSQDPTDLATGDCGCLSTWRRSLEEGVLLRTAVDTERHMDDGLTI